MKMCFICSEYPPGPHGGIGTMTQVLSRAMRNSGHEVRVVGVYPRNYPAPYFEEDQGVEVWRLREPAHVLGWIHARHMLYRQVAAWIRKGFVDLIEVPDHQGWAAGWRRLPVPVVTRLHGSLSYFAAELGRQMDSASFWLERASLRRADFWCSVSRYTADKTQQLFRLRAGPSAILYNPVEIPGTLRPCIAAGQQVVFSGTLTTKKGVISLIQAWPSVLQKCSGAELHVFGKDGRAPNGFGMQEFLQSQLPGQARQTVHFHGHVSRDRLFEAFQTARVAVFPSHAEAFAVAPLEAMTCGCPTIYSRRGSGPELLADEQEGLLVDPDNPEEIASSIVRVLTNPELAGRLGEAGRKRVHSFFSMPSLLSQNLDFYQDCIYRFRAAQSN